MKRGKNYKQMESQEINLIQKKRVFKPFKLVYPKLNSEIVNQGSIQLWI